MQLTLSGELLENNRLVQHRMNITKSEPDSDPEAQQSHSESRFMNVYQKFLSLPASFTEIKVSLMDVWEWGWHFFLLIVLVQELFVVSYFILTLVI